MIARFRFLALLVLASFALVLVGCPMGPTLIVQQYEGPPRPRETIAILRVNGKDPIRLATLDSEEMTAPIASDTRLHIEMSPGRHMLSIRDPNARDRVAWKAVADKVYRVVVEPSATPPVRVHEVDRESDALGADVTETHAEP